jgi:hypothetical protein
MAQGWWVSIFIDHTGRLMVSDNPRRPGWFTLSASLGYASVR